MLRGRKALALIQGRFSDLIKEEEELYFERAHKKELYPITYIYTSYKEAPIPVYFTNQVPVSHNFDPACQQFFSN